MENLGNTGDGDVIPTLDLPEFTENDPEAAELITNSLDMFEAANESDSLDRDINLAKEPAISHEKVRPFLGSLPEIRGSQGATNNALELENGQSNSGPQDAASNRAHESLTNQLKTIRDLHVEFKATNDINYLNLAIGIAEELISSDGLSVRNLMRFGELLRVRYDRTEKLEDIRKAIAWIGAGVKYIPPGRSRTAVLGTLASMLSSKYKRSGDLRDLGQAIIMAKAAIAATPPDDPDRAGRLSNLGRHLSYRYDRLENLHDLEQAITWTEEALAATPLDHPNRTVCLNNLGRLFISRYERLGDLHDLGQAITWAEEALAATPLDHPDRAVYLNNLGNMFGSRYERLGALHDLEQAITRVEEAVAAKPLGHPSRHAVYLNSLSRCLNSRYERLRDLHDLEQAITWAEEALAATPHDHPDRAGMLSNLSNCLSGRYKQLGGLHDLQQAIMWAEEADAATPPDHPGRAGRLSTLSIHLGSRYKQLGDLHDLQQAIMWAEEAVAATPPDHPDREAHLNNLGNLFIKRYNRFGDLHDLEQAVAWAEKLLAMTPLDCPIRAVCLNNLGNMFDSRYERLGALHDLEQAITRVEEAVVATPPDHPDRAGMLSSLSIHLSSRYERLGDLHDLEQAITWTKEALTATPLDHPDHAVCLNNLGNMFGSRYERLGALHDLEQAIMQIEEAVAATPLDNPDRAGMLNNLSNYLSGRYERLGNLHDLEQAITWAEEAVAATPPDYPGRAGRLSTLSIHLSSRYERLGDLHDLEQAIMWAEEALAVTPLDHPDRAAYLNNLGNGFNNRFNQLGDLRDLEQAITRVEGAVAATPSDHPSRAGRLSNLSSHLSSRYKRLGDLHDLEQAITRVEEAVAAMPLNRPDRAKALSVLISSLNSMYQRTGSTQNLHYILRNSYEVWHGQVYTPVTRIRIARGAGLLLASREMWQESSALLTGAVRMLPRVSPQSLGRDDQEHRLSDFAQLAAEAVSVAFRAGEEAVYGLRLLEFGRGIITGLVIDCRSDLSDLESNQPELFNKFHQLRIEIDSPLLRMETDHGRLIYQQRRHRREKALGDLEETLSSIRELPGFEGFQLPPNSGDLMSIASEGPIVIFNSTQFRSDAIILTSSTIKALALPNLSYSLVEDRMSQVAQLARGGRATYQSRNKKMGEILLWLWDVAVEPVFAALQYTVVDAGSLPRVWWIGVGLLAMAPFHAAGDHSPGSTRNTISRAISSYVPTIKSLSYARQKPLELLSRPDARLLLVYMPTTPADKLAYPVLEPLNPLKNAKQEVEAIASLVKGKAITTSLGCPSTAQVIAELPSHHVIHFACHGVSDGRNPSNSHLVLRKDDGSESGTVDKLTVGDISNMKIKQAQIAYLSACSTAENASESLVDESIYIASGFHLAGFSHVLAAQWLSNDRACMRVAGDFYSLLFRSQPSGSGKEGHRRVSAAFHHAVKKLRDANLEQPILWAPYIHTGA